MSNLLLLEDDISLIDGLYYSLKKNGFYVDIARTVEEAEKQLAQIEKYDLLILDVTLPDGTGFEKTAEQGSVLRHGKTLDRRSDGAGKDTFAAFRRGTDSAGRSAGDRGVCEAGWL